MKRALIAVTGTALILAPAGAAWAETPQPTVIDVAKACGVVTLTLTGPDDGISGTHGFRWNAVNGNVATDEGSRTGTVVVNDDEVEKLNIAFAEDEFGGTAAVTVAVYFGPNSHLQQPLDIYPVDTDCLPPVTTTEPTTPPTTTAPVETPTPTPTPTSTPTLPPADDDIDCDDVTDAEAQRILDADPADPNRLDGDRDGTACDDEDDNFTDVGVAPRGGVATGG